MIVEMWCILSSVDDFFATEWCSFKHANRPALMERFNDVIVYCVHKEVMRRIWVEFSMANSHS